MNAGRKSNKRSKTSPDASKGQSSKKSSGDNKQTKAEKPSDSTPSLFASIRQLSLNRWLVIIFAVALVFRVWHVLQTSSIPCAVHPLGDAQGYVKWAQKIANESWYGTETFYQAPLYPYFLATLTELGSGVLEMRLFQALLGALGVVVFGLAMQRWFDERIGLISATILAIYAPAIYYDGIIQKASLALFLLCVFLLCVGHWRKIPGVVPALLSGIALAMLMLTRENALLWLPVPALWAIFEFRESTKRERAKWIGAYLGGLALILFPVAARNASLGGEWSPTTFQAGPNFYIGNNLEADGIYFPLVPGHETPLHERSDAVRLAEQATGKELSAREVSKFWMSKSWDEIRENPTRWLQLMFAKSMMVINRYEVPDVESMAFYQRYSPPLMILAKWSHFGLLFPLAVVGLLLRFRDWKSDGLLIALLAIMIGAIVLFFILGRYRLPLVPLMIPFAAIAVVKCIELVHEKDWRRMGLAIVLPFIIAAFIGNMNIHDVNGLEASSIKNVGIAAAQREDYPTAIRFLREAESLSPDEAETHVSLGQALALTGQTQDALREFQIAIRLRPDLIPPYIYAARLLEQIGRIDQAVMLYEGALSVEPNSLEAREGIARLRDLSTRN